MVGHLHIPLLQAQFARVRETHLVIDHNVAMECLLLVLVFLCTSQYMRETW